MSDIILIAVWRDVRDGRRSMIGNHVSGNNRFRGSNPRLSAKALLLAEVLFILIIWRCTQVAEGSGFEHQ